MSKYKAEVEFDDDGASMAGSYCGTQRMAEIITIECPTKESFMGALRDKFKRERYYSTIRRVGAVEEA